MRDSDDKNYGTDKGVDDKDFLAEMRERHQAARGHWSSQYHHAKQDMEFVFTPDKQWDETMRDARKGRPCYTFNKLRQALKQVTNDQRQNRPQPKLRAVDDTDKEMVDLREGIIRGIERLSNADRAYDTAFQFAVGGGYGAIRIITDYVDADSFEQDIIIKEVANPYAIYWDPSAIEKDRRDAAYVTFEQKLKKSEFKRRWPKADMTNFENSEIAKNHVWCTDEDVTVLEYWYKEYEKRTLLLLSDNRVIDADEAEQIVDELTAQGITVKNERTTEVPVVKWCICAGNEILEGPTEWAGKFIPFVPVWGDIINIDGKDVFSGMVSYAKDAQRLYNYERTAFVETLAKQPKSPILATGKMIEKYRHIWESLGTDDPPVLPYDPDPQAPGARPTREMPPALPAAFIQAAQVSSDDIKATTGKFDASLGARSNETSGRAIAMRQREGDVASFDYIDNLGYAQKYVYEIVNDLIPHIYDTERQIRFVSADEAEKVMRVNQVVFDEQTGQHVTVNDLSRGRYDIAVTIGPSYNTQRMELADAMMQLANDPTPFGMLAKYVYFKSLDMPQIEVIVKSARKLLVQQGLLEPEEGDTPPQPPQPDPKMVADAKRLEAQAAKLEAEAQGQTLENELLSFQHGMALGQLEIPPPLMQQQPNPAPQGAFFSPQAFEPMNQQSAPDGFPG